MKREDDMLPGLRRFGDDIGAAADARLAAPSAPRRRRLTRPVVVLAALFLLAAGAAGAAKLISVGKPAPARRDAPPRTGTVSAPRIVVVARDPQGLLPWGAGIYQAANGASCIVAGRLKAGRLGQLQGRTFRPLPPGSFGACGRPGARTFFFTAGAAPGEPGRGLVFGRTGADVKALSVRTQAGTRTVTPGAGGAFLLVYDAPVKPRDVDLTARH